MENDEQNILDAINGTEEQFLSSKNTEGENISKNDKSKRSRLKYILIVLLVLVVLFAIWVIISLFSSDSYTSGGIKSLSMYQTSYTKDIDKIEPSKKFKAGDPIILELDFDNLGLGATSYYYNVFQTNESDSDSGTYRFSSSQWNEFKTAVLETDGSQDVIISSDLEDVFSEFFPTPIEKFLNPTIPTTSWKNVVDAVNEEITTDGDSVMFSVKSWCAIIGTVSWYNCDYHSFLSDQWEKVRTDLKSIDRGGQLYIDQEIADDLAEIFSLMKGESDYSISNDRIMAALGIMDNVKQIGDYVYASDGDYCKLGNILTRIGCHPVRFGSLPIEENDTNSRYISIVSPKGTGTSYIPGREADPSLKPGKYTFEVFSKGDDVTKGHIEFEVTE
jgi:hypothetical protein